MVAQPQEWEAVLTITKWVLAVGGCAWLVWLIHREDLDALGRLKRLPLPAAIMFFAASLPFVDPLFLYKHTVGYFAQFCPGQPALAYPMFITVSATISMVASILYMGFLSFRYETQAGRSIASFFHRFIW